MKNSVSTLSVIAALVLGLAPGLSSQLLHRQLMATNPDTYVMSKSVTNSAWSVDLFCQVYSSAPAYVCDTLYNLWHSLSVYVEPCWSRLIYIDDDMDDGLPARVREHGSYGSGVDSLDEPMAVDIISPTGWYYWYSTYYNIYVADRGNHRVQKLRYRWTTPDSGLIHVQYYEGGLWRPTDLDVSNSGSFYYDWDDLIWVACKHDRILAFWEGGTQYINYGATGSGVGQFNDIRAIVCGKTFYEPSTSTYFANNKYVYVLDAGNERIVRLSRSGSVVQWVLEWDNVFAGVFTDLEVDVCGHVWATDGSGRIFKFTPNLEPLGIFGSAGTGPNHFDYPVSVANTGGYLGGGDMMICEKWTSQSGLQHYAIGTDVYDLFINNELRNDTCWSLIWFTLADYSKVNVVIYDSVGHIVRNLVTNYSMASGLQAGGWNGSNNAGHLVPWGSYRVEVTASSTYLGAEGQPVNTVVENAWVRLCQGQCTWKVGDANGNTLINIADPVYLIQYIFGGGPAPTPHPVGSGDPNCSGSVNVSDVVYLINFVFSGGPPPGNPDNFGPPDCNCSSYF